MPTETTELPKMHWRCDCFNSLPAGEEAWRIGYVQCQCCGALMTATEYGQFPRHVHVTRFSDVVALPGGTS